MVPAARPQRVGHEVTAPALIGLLACLKGLTDTCRQSPLAASGQIQMELAVHTPQHRLTPGLVLVTGAGVQQAESVSWIGTHIGLDKLDYPGVVRRLVAVAQCGAGNAAGNTGSALAHAVVGHERVHHISPTLRGQSFRSTTSFRAWCMRARSAYMRLSLVFSSCNSRN